MWTSPLTYSPAEWLTASQNALQAVLADLNSTGFEIDAETIVKAKMKGFKIVEVL